MGSDTASNTDANPHAGGLAGAVGIDEAAELARHSTPSAAAIISLLLGAMSWVGFVAPILLIVPAAGILTAFLALRHIAASDGALIGRRAAYAGTLLAIASGCASVTYYTTTKSFRITQSDAIARQFLELMLAGDSKRAYHLAMAEEPRELTPDEINSPMNPMEKLLSRPAVKALLAAGPQAKIGEGDVVEFKPGWNGEFFVRERFVVTPSPTSQQPAAKAPFAVVVYLRRWTIYGQNLASWQITDIYLLDKVTDTASDN